MQSALQRELDNFFGKIESSSHEVRQLTKGAFTQARAKLNEYGFQRLTQIVLETFYQQADVKKWHNHRLIGVDGTRLMLPNHPTIKQEFGTTYFGPQADSQRSMAIASMLFDVLNHMPLDARIAPYKSINEKSSSEQALLQEHLPTLQEGDLLLMDRGYPSLALFLMLMARGIDFCVRMKVDWWKDVQKFVKSNQKEHIVEFRLPESQKNKLKDYPQWQNAIIKCRLVRIELDNGEIEVLCTSLIDMQKYPHHEFKALYHLRWGHEEAYKLLKNRIEVENFSGKTANAVKQDFHAKIFLLALTAAYANPVDDQVKEDFKANDKRKHPQKINRTNTIAKTRNVLLIGIFIKKQYLNVIKAFDDLVYKTREIIRRGRSFVRKKKPKKTYAMNYKKL